MLIVWRAGSQTDRPEQSYSIGSGGLERIEKRMGTKETRAGQEGRGRGPADR